MAQLPATTQNTEITHPDRGHPPVIFRDKDRARKILKCRNNGGSKVMCAQVGNIGRRTLYAWLERAEAIRDARMEDPLIQVTPYDKDYLWFLHEWENADFNHKLRHLKNIEDAADDGNIKASQWLLTKLHPEEFGNNPPDRVMDSGDKKQQIVMLNIPSLPTRRPIEILDAEIVEYE